MRFGAGGSLGRGTLASRKPPSCILLLFRGDIPCSRWPAPVGVLRLREVLREKSRWPTIPLRIRSNTLVRGYGDTERLQAFINNKHVEFAPYSQYEREENDNNTADAP